MPINNVIAYRHPQHGVFEAHPFKVDELAYRYVHLLTDELRELVEEQTELDYSDVTSASAFLIILASFESEL
jgi:hypothetical protein